MKVIAEQKISTNCHEEMARFAKALAHPTRPDILRLISNQSFCFKGDLLELLPIAQSTVSQHLKELKNAGLLQGEINPYKMRHGVNNENWNKAKLLTSS